MNIKVEFPFAASNVVLHIWGSYSRDISMEEMQKGVFTSEIPYTNELLFNISYDLPEFSIHNWWVASGNSYIGTNIPNRFDPHGLKYGKIYIGGQPIDNTFLVLNPSQDGLNIAVKIKSDNSISPMGNNTEIVNKMDARIPAEVHHHFAYKNTSYPTSKDNDIAGWMQAVTGNNFSGIGKIEVDYVKLYGRQGNKLILLRENKYEDYSPTNDGGLYLRYPFFPKDKRFDQPDPMPGKTDGNILTFFPSSNQKKVWHWWTPHYQTYQGFNFDSYRMVCKAKITGNILVQAGIDFKDSNNVTHELGCSNWYFENGGAWQEIVFDSGF